MHQSIFNNNTSHKSVDDTGENRKNWLKLIKNFVITVLQTRVPKKKLVVSLEKFANRESTEYFLHLIWMFVLEQELLFLLIQFVLWVYQVQ